MQRRQDAANDVFPFHCVLHWKTFVQGIEWEVQKKESLDVLAKMKRIDWNRFLDNAIASRNDCAPKKLKELVLSRPKDPDQLWFCELFSANTEASFIFSCHIGYLCHSAEIEISFTMPLPRQAVIHAVQGWEIQCSVESRSHHEIFGTHAFQLQKGDLTCRKNNLHNHCLTRWHCE